MTAQLAVPVVEPVDGGDEVDLVSYFQSLYTNRSLAPVLDLELDDERAIVDQVRICDVEVFSDGVSVNYKVSFSAYYGCRDQNYADSDYRHLAGVRIGDQWVFDHHEPTPKRYPNEEL